MNLPRFGFVQTHRRPEFDTFWINKEHFKEHGLSGRSMIRQGHFPDTDAVHAHKLMQRVPIKTEQTFVLL